ncbi:MAG TPA: SusC/RagA family TonB-linked outer membrane protein [Bacteroidia bacterium]|jgi:TonB-linked SusC/RagA family outer membrane protein|nr:SusC/RagA family TonB-linked outer membrane protein [Bacteroidia bacterium]
MLHKKRKLTLSFLFLFATLTFFGQSKTIKGTIKDSKTNEAVIGATIMEAGTGNGTITDVEGNYTLQVSDTAKFVLVSFMGYTTKKVSITGEKVDINLDPDGVLLKETVVTAVGMSREKKSLGYATQEVKGDVIKDSRENNVINSLSGRVAGLNITSSSGAVGASSQIVLRGQTSFTGNNSPLFVINGVPVDNNFRASRDNAPNYGNPISDINPDDIESINILKGPIAAALYGSRAQNGAIIVTTKSGKGLKGKNGGFQVSVNMGVSMDKTLILPKFQNKYGQGYWGDDPHTSMNYMAADESWGAPLDGRTYTDFLGKTQQWLPQPNNVKDFFQTGHQIDNAVSIASSDEKGSVRMSFSTFNQTGTIPNTAYDRYTTGLTLNRQLTNKLTVDASITYNLTQGQNRPGTGYGGMGNPLEGMFAWWGRQLDIHYLKDHYNDIDPTTGQHATWNFYHNNPYWVLYNNTSSDRRDRVLSNLKFTYKITPWLTASVRGGSDFYVENRFQKYKVGTVTDAVFQKGGFYDDNARQNTSNLDAMLIANKNLGKDFSISGTIGYNYYGRTLNTNSNEVRGLLVPDYYTLTNAANTPIVSNVLAKKEIVGLYGLASLGYKGMLYVDVTARNDWSSTLPIANHSYFYPSVSSSFIFTELMKQNKWLSFGKVRAGLAFTGNDTDPYNLYTTFVKSEIGVSPSITSNPFNGVTYMTMDNALKNSSIKPESTRSFEFGTDLRFLNNRVGLDVTYYNTLTKDIIVPVSIPASTGFSTKVVNAGQILNQGVELMLNAAVIQNNDGFNWNVMVNYSKNVGKIQQIAEGLDKISMYHDWAYLYLVQGHSYGSLYANGANSAMKDSHGNYLISPGGDLIANTSPQFLGDIQPKFRVGIDNNFSYKGFYFGFLIDWKQGGKIFSQTNMWMDYTGNSLRTENRDSIVTPGMSASNVNGQWVSSGQANGVKVDPSTYWHERTFNDFANYVYDATFVKLRQISFGYKIPAKYLSRSPFSSITFGVYARNVLILYSKLPYMDPEVNSANSANSGGFESNAVPSTRSFGMNLKVVF